MRLLTDEHIPREVAAALRKRFPKLDAVSIYDTDLAGMQDRPLLAVLDEQARVLVTRDVNSIPRHVKERLAEGKTHGGIIYADSKRLRQRDARGLIRRLVEVVEKYQDQDWTCRSGWL